EAHRRLGPEFDPVDPERDPPCPVRVVARPVALLPAAARLHVGLGDGLPHLGLAHRLVRRALLDDDLVLGHLDAGHRFDADDVGHLRFARRARDDPGSGLHRVAVRTHVAVIALEPLVPELDVRRGAGALALLVAVAAALALVAALAGVAALLVLA